MGPQFFVKDFRTYGANLYFLHSLLVETKKRTPKNRKVIKKNLLNSFKTTARQLKHTGAVSKKSYVMSFITELYQNNPEFFIDNKNADANKLLIKILELYNKNILLV
jgi:DNA topoisomerase IB